MSQRRRRIVEAAYRRFVQDGFAAASVDSICAEAGISKGAFYVHFKSKEALVHAVAELRSDEIGRLPGDSIDALAESILDLLIVPMLDPKAARFELEAMMASVADPQLGALATANLNAIRDRSHEALARIGATGSEASAARIMTYCLGIILNAAAWASPGREEARTALIGLMARCPAAKPKDAGSA